jgi:hypothetical protein
MKFLKHFCEPQNPLFPVHMTLTCYNSRRQEHEKSAEESGRQDNVVRREEHG